MLHSAAGSSPLASLEKSLITTPIAPVTPFGTFDPVGFLANEQPPRTTATQSAAMMAPGKRTSHSLCETKLAALQLSGTGTSWDGPYYADRIERELDKNKQAQPNGQKDQDGSEIRSVELERLTAEG